MIAYRVRGGGGAELIRAHVRAVAGRPKTSESMVSGKRVTVTTGPIRARRGYLYAHDGVLYAAGSDHVTPRELRELMSKLP